MSDTFAAMETQAESKFKVDLRCPRCRRANMKRNDGSYTPHKRLTMKNRESGSGAKWVQCVGYERANATKNGDGGIA